eukprot:scaffold3437_cov113-Cylindrotheca_fusiformis.AAC.49
MPPNRRHSSRIVDDTPVFDLQVKAFPPLTSEIESQSQRSHQKNKGGCIIQASHTKNMAYPNNSYWDWPGVDEEEAKEAIVEQEKVVDLFSAAHIEANLVKDKAEAKADTVYAASVDEEYWYVSNDERATTDRPASTAQSQYWDWPTQTPDEKKQGAIDNVMEEERVRQLLTATRIVQNIVRHSANSVVTSNSNLSSDRYWDWRAGDVCENDTYWNWPSSQEDLNKLLIQIILNEESLRHQFSIQHLESTLLATSALEKPAQVVASTGAGSAYWDCKVGGEKSTQSRLQLIDHSHLARLGQFRDYSALLLPYQNSATLRRFEATTTSRLIILILLSVTIICYHTAAHVQMPINKYNVRAIRNDLDSCIRYKSWSKFRRVFQPLDTALQQAVAKEQMRKNKQSSSPSLLYALCRCISPSSCPPLDVFESVVKASPISLKTGNPQKESTMTHLAVAVGRQAPPAVVEALLRHDKAAQGLLYHKGRGGDTPILAAVRQMRPIQQEQRNVLKVVQLLVRHDPTRQSLLIPTKTKQHVPLYYVASQEIPLISEAKTKKADAEIDLDEGLEFLLTQTYQAIEIQKGRLKPQDRWEQEEEHTDIDERGFFLDNRSSLQGGSEQRKADHVMLLIQATLTCAHLLGPKNALKLTHYLIRQMDDMKFTDSDGHLLLDCACRAAESNAFLEPCFVQHATAERCNLLQYLISKFPTAPILSNHHEDIPLHVAILHKKNWQFLQHLCPSSVASSVLQAKSRHQQLALHLSIEQYPSKSPEILQLWNLFPEAATIVDGKHRLFAFQLVAAFRNQHHLLRLLPSSSDECNFKLPAVGEYILPPKKDLQDLQLIFVMLTAYPQVLRHYI